MKLEYLYIFGFFILYFSYCSLVTFRKKKNIDIKDKLQTNSFTNIILFTFTATAFSMCGWLLIAHPALIFRDGFSYSYLGLITILIPLTGVLFLNKLWIIKKVFNLKSLDQILSHYFKSENIKFFCSIVSFFFCISFLATSIIVSGKVFDFLTDGKINFFMGSLISSFLLYYYLYFEKNDSISLISSIQFFLFILAILLISIYILIEIGGLYEFKNLLKKLSLIDNLKWDGAKNENSLSLFVIPELFRFSSSLEDSTPVGGIWTVSMIFSTSIIFLGIQTSPSFTMFAITNGNPSLFSKYQFYVSGIIFGFIILTLPIIIGFGSHFLGANYIINNLGLNVSKLLPESLSLANEGNLILEIISSLKSKFSIALGLFLLCLITSIHSSTALFLNFSIKSYINNIDMDDYKKNQKYQIILTLIFLLTLFLIIFFEKIILSFGFFSLNLSLQLLIAIISICYFPVISKIGIIIGISVGMTAVFLTEEIGLIFFGEYLMWGKWPMYISSGIWGLIFNILFSIVFSIFFQNEEEKQFRENFQSKINEYEGISKNNNYKRFLISVSLIILWILFSLGPLNIFGNNSFGDPRIVDSWFLGLPSIWIWQLISWVLGIIIIWTIAYKLKFSKIGQS